MEEELHKENEKERRQNSKDERERNKGPQKERDTSQQVINLDGDTPEEAQTRQEEERASKKELENGKEMTIKIAEKQREGDQQEDTPM